MNFGSVRKWCYALSSSHYSDMDENLYLDSITLAIADATNYRFFSSNFIFVALHFASNLFVPNKKNSMKTLFPPYYKFRWVIESGWRNWFFTSLLFREMNEASFLISLSCVHERNVVLQFNSSSEVKNLAAVECKGHQRKKVLQDSIRGSG